MADNPFTQITTQSWGQRMGSSCGGVVVGAIMFLGSFVLLFWNEGRAVRDAKAIAEGASSVVSVTADRVDQANDGKLIHVTGPAATADKLTDAQFGVSEQVLRLTRVVEMYQWAETIHEKTEKRGTSTDTKTWPTYEEKWSAEPLKSESFQDKSKHNPPMELITLDQPAKRVTLGAFTLSDALIGKIVANQARPATQGDIDRMPEAGPAQAKWKRKAEIREGMIYLPAATQPAAGAQIGDMRVQFKLAQPGTVSVIGKQVGNSFEPYAVSGGMTFLLLKPGSVDAKQMFAEEASKSQTLTWILRLVGFVLMFVGLLLVARPLTTMVDFIPLIGDLMGVGVGLVAIVLALPLSLITIAVAWLFYRPLIGVGLLVGAVAIIVLAKMAFRKPKPG